MERLAALRRVLFLKTLPDNVLVEVASAGTERVLQKGELLFAESSKSLGLIVVLSGSVKIYKVDSRGRELTLGLEMPGESVEEVVLFDGGNYPASAEAATHDTAVLIVPRERFQQMMVTYPEIAVQALRALAVRLRKQVSMIEVQSMHTVRARLAAYLLRVADGRVSFVIEETNETIASQIGTVRDVVSRTLSALKQAGEIQLRGRRVIITDVDSVRLIATSEART